MSKVFLMGRMVPVTDYPKITTIIEESDDRVKITMSTRIRIKYTDGLYYWNNHLENIEVDKKDSAQAVIEITNKFHFSIYTYMIFGRVDPNLITMEGDQVYKLCENQEDEKTRMKKIIG